MAIILEFPREVSPRRRVIDDDGDVRGEIVLFTGVRYERWSDDEAAVGPAFDEPDEALGAGTAEVPQGH